MPSEIAVVSERSVLPEARRFARRLSPDAFTVEWSDAPAVARDVVLYVKGNEQEPKLRAFLGRFKKRRYRRMVVYSPARSPEAAARLGMMIGHLALKRTELVFEPERVAGALEIPASPSSAELGPADLRRRLGLTQEQMAAAIGITVRTLQNWESGKLGQNLDRKLRDLRELVTLVEDYIPSDKRAQWLRAPLAAFEGANPAQMIQEGRTRDLIIEFRRLQEGQPL
jgi:transcriptional regulator with XRE-family HTH domain